MTRAASIVRARLPGHRSFLGMSARPLVAVAIAASQALAQDGVAPDWAFQPLRVVQPPAVADAAWNTNAIDRFVYARLAAAGLQPAPLAERRTLIRRASFVLIGLPPSPAEVEAFVADDSPDAWARVVDRLLASPHYGEQQARAWLDLARYSDSNGLDENLAFANAWRYRDWVVKAHNDDLPYDRFVTLQLAGDLLAGDPAVGLDGDLATGFLALGPRMLAEQDKEKLVLDTVDEQLDLVGRTVLGLTIGCARCHDHKFDPISQRDYYALAGIFRSTKSFQDLGHVSKWFARELASDDAIAARRAAEHTRDDAAKALERAQADAHAEQRRALVADSGRYLLAGDELLARSVFVQAEAARATSLHADSEHWGDADTTVLHTTKVGEQFAEWAIELPGAGRWHLAVRCASEESRPMRVRLDGAVAADKVLVETTGGWLPAHQQWFDVAAFDASAGSHVLRLEGHGAHVPHLDCLLLTPADANASDLLPVIVRHAAAVLAVQLKQPLLAFWKALADGPADEFGARVAAAQGKGGLAAILLGGLPPASPRELAARVQTFLATAAAAADAAAKGTDKQTEKKDDKKPVHLAEPQLEAARALLFDRGGLLALPPAALRPFLPATTLARLQELGTQRDRAAAAVPAPAPTAMCVAEETVKDLPVLYRGNHLAPADAPTPRGVPAVFASFVPAPSMPATQSGRVELARWLFAPEQALAARVQANRIWQRAFGDGLVRSPSNFGRRGDRPVHVELLDWVADSLRANGWSQKHLWRELLLSRTWQLACGAPADAALRDPENRLFGHRQRQRLAAEGIRDAMLATAGTLDRTPGGSLLATGDRDYVTNDQSNDAAKYDAPRRSLYLPIIRNAMYDLFVAFDYGDPSVHLEQRAQSAVAPQALFLLNAPFVREQAKLLAARALAAAGDDDARIAWLWREAFARTASAHERTAAAAWLATARSTGDEVRAWAGLAQALFASNEFVYVD
jgi:hypothetical protein